MKAYFENLSMQAWLLLVVAAILLAYPIFQILAPAMVHAMVPDVVGQLLRVI